ncbi:D-methionine transport system substrate-binding protein [Paenibacillus sp. V4I3]|uniref:MetQ/NlpA family ABC transporter substrate-binding protein n=1 Tax=unclassified Paenibacillus TaxID=185978 RepID=UPI0027879E80|nr:MULTISPECIES: MetQ/NlpA family ABC transporter substrate-binding protein [unclassified Paenibacillus]MDQ0877697.1 D-methionine transport system substrate-binding protein [Paenibacillus sp. V4I3]MDQ0886428.1 D-methionine transport system substrate-binding protein [Paenibacillus sp. V4I9]
MKRSHLISIFTMIVILVVTGCGKTVETKTATSVSAAPTAAASPSSAPSPAASPASEKAKLKVGISAGVEEEIWKKVKEVAAKDNLEIEIVTFNDYIQPNKVLADGQLDANAFQHEPYLNQFKADNKLDIVKLANTLNFPIGLYSKKIKNVSEIKEGDELGLPNDPSNGARALILFERAGLIKLKEGVGVKATVRDIVDNPKKLKFKELEAPFIPKALPDLTAAVINTNYAVDNGFVPTKDAIFIEPKDSPWVNLIAVRTADKDKPVYQRLIKAYHSEEVKKLVLDKYGSYIVPSW